MLWPSWVGPGAGRCARRWSCASLAPRRGRATSAATSGSHRRVSRPCLRRRGPESRLRSVRCCPTAADPRSSVGSGRMAGRSRGYSSRSSETRARPRSTTLAATRLTSSRPSTRASARSIPGRPWSYRPATTSSRRRLPRGGDSQAGPQLDIYLQARARFPGPLFPALGNHECTGATSSNCGAGAADGVTANYSAFLEKMLAPIGQDEALLRARHRGGRRNLDGESRLRRRQRVVHATRRPGSRPRSRSHPRTPSSSGTNRPPRRARPA